MRNLELYKGSKLWRHIFESFETKEDVAKALAYVWDKSWKRV